MLNLSARTRVSELQSGPPALLATLKSIGIYRDGDNPDAMLGELCWNFGFNPGILLMMLQSANVPEEIPPLDIAPYRDMPLASLVDHIAEVHHEYLRRELPRLTAMTAEAAERNNADERLTELRDEMAGLAAELDAHLLHEEEALFQMIRDLGNGATVTPTRCGGSVGGPIACMENEHDRAAQALRKLRELTGDYASPDDADAAFRAMMAALAFFDQDLREHMYKENHALFPRAVDAQRGQRVAATG